MSGQFFTSTEIARAAGVERTTIHYRAKALGIKPAFVATRTMLYTAEDAKRLAEPMPRGRRE